MCLEKNRDATEKFRKKNKNKRKVVVWKIYCVDNNNIVSPAIYDDGGCTNPGYIESDRIDKYQDEYDMCNTINRGIHVYVSRGKAREMRDIGEKIFKCTAKIDDLVAVGGYRSGRKDEAVFMKIHISKEEFEKGIKGRN